MNDRSITVLEQYDIPVDKIRKGRGVFLFDSNGQSYVLKEYQGAKERLVFLAAALEAAYEKGAHNIERIYANKEGELITEDFEHTPFFVKSYFPGKECDLTNVNECIVSMKALATLHNRLAGFFDEVDIDKLPFLREIEKHNKELTKVRRFLKEKSQKTEFELFLLKHYDNFFTKAKNIILELEKENIDVWLQEIKSQKWICHGEYQHHNILVDKGNCYVVNFEKMIVDNPIRDVYLFLRKLMEKNNWKPELYYQLLDAYCSVRELSANDISQLKYRFWYPEKFWKIVNFYYNNSKAWMSYKNQEKLEKFLEQDKYKQIFLEKVFFTDI